jgi:hypothetical protein
MTTSSKTLRHLAAAIGISLSCISASCCYKIARVDYVTGVAPPNPLGYAVDPVMQIQETNGEASDFVIYDHEFVGDTVRLNTAGEDHVKEIAVRVPETPFPIVIERSMSSSRPGDKYHFPVHPNPALDDARRALVVQVLLAMGVADAEERTVVAPAIAEGFDSIEAERAYYRGLSGSGVGGRGGSGGVAGGGIGGAGGF